MKINETSATKAAEELKGLIGKSAPNQKKDQS